MDVDLIFEEPRGREMASWRRDIAHGRWVVVGGANREAFKQCLKHPQERVTAVHLLGPENTKPPTTARLPSLFLFSLAAHSLWFSWGVEQQLVSRGGHARERGQKPNISFCMNSYLPSLSWGVGGRSPALNEDWNGNNALGRHIQELNWDCVLWLNMAVELNEWNKKLQFLTVLHLPPLNIFENWP